MAPESSTATSWFLPVLIGVFTIYVLKRLIPRSKVYIKEKFVLVTGCDSGFGREMAIRLDKMGVRVLATCLTKEGEQSLRSVASDKLKTFQMDVTNSQQIKDVFEEVKRLIPHDTGLWGLVNNAGVLHFLPIEWMPLEIYKRTADVNLWGLIDVTKTFLPLVKKARGRVVNMSSVAGKLSINLYSSYAITKYGVEAFSDALRREMYPWGIKVSMLEPGAFKTTIMDPTEKRLREGFEGLGEELQKEYGRDYLERAIKFFNSLDLSTRTYQVVDAVVDALTSQSPPDRYLLGNDARFLFRFIIMSPTAVADFISRMLLKLPKPPGSK